MLFRSLCDEMFVLMVKGGLLFPPPPVVNDGKPR